jgi:3-deoxy-D-manno-octulosonic-acid transferase
MHAPSVGEGLQARAVLELVRARHPEMQLAYTFYSPSAEPFADSLAVDFADYLPFDTAGDARVALDALRPSALIFSKLDVWPVLVDEAARRGVPLGLVSGSLSAVSSRQGGLAAGLLRESYQRLDRVGAVSEEDAGRLVHLGVLREHITITGDTRYDQAWDRARRTTKRAPLLSPLVSARPTLVAGSTWPPDEAILLPAWLALRRDVTDARLIIAPHEPNEAHLRPILEWAGTQGLAVARLGSSDAGPADVVVVDRVGVLGDLYGLADAAFVGGGFHAAGLHSVLEPAAFGVPVAFGPRNHNSRDAAALLDQEGGAVVSTVDETIEVLVHWLGDASVRARAGTAALSVVEHGRGAAEQSYQLIMELLEAAKSTGSASGGGTQD